MTQPATYTCAPGDRIAVLADGTRWLLYPVSGENLMTRFNRARVGFGRELRRRQRKEPTLDYARVVAKGGEVVMTEAPKAAPARRTA